MKKLFKRKIASNPLDTTDKRTKSAVGRSDGKIPVIMFCWGNSSDCQLGIGSSEPHFIPSPKEHPFSEAANVVHVACGRRHTIAVTDSGELYSCGNNDHGQLGRERDTTKFELVDGIKGQRIVSACCGDNHSLAVTEWGQLYGWGSDSHSQLCYFGKSQPVPKIMRDMAMYNVIQVACGQAHSLALTQNGVLYTWGANNLGQCGIGKTSQIEGVAQIIYLIQGVPIAVIASGANHSVAVSKSGAVFSWGSNSHGQLGVNSINQKIFPEQVATHRNMKVKYVSCGENFTAFLTADGGVFTCGDNEFGQLGHGSLNNELIPRKVMELMGSTVTQIVCGRNHMMAFVPSTGQVYAFGSGALGQLGIEDCARARMPQIVPGPWTSKTDTSLHITNIYSGSDHCFAKVAYLSDVYPDDKRVFQQRSQIATLNEDIIARCGSVPPDGPMDYELFSHLEIIFSQVGCFNGSFLTENDQHYCCTEKNHGIDLPKVERVFGHIAKIQNDALKDLVFTGITKGILPNLFKMHFDCELLRAFVILPLYHNFDNPKYVNQLQLVYSKNLLSDRGHNTVAQWWAGLPMEYFERLVRIFKDVLAYQLVNEKKVKGIASFSAEIECILLVLALLYKTNEENKILQHEAFYVHELNVSIDIHSDFRAWVVSNRKKPKRCYFCDFPFLFDVEAKIVLLQIEQAYQMQVAMSEVTARSFASLFLFQNYAEDHFLCFNIDRNDMVSSTISQLMSVDSAELKKPLKVTFLGEEAEDAGGVRKEFFLLIMKEVLDPKFGMFTHFEETRTIWFNEFSFDEDMMYMFIGNLCGLAIYNFTIIDLPFPLALYKKILNEKVTYMDLKELSPTVYKSLQDILDDDDSDLEETLGLTFEISRERYGEIVNIELKEGAGATPVTQKNKQEYVELYADYILNKSVATRFNAFLDGFRKVCDGCILKMFHAQELMALVVGNENYDWEVFEATTEYKGVYWEKHPTIRLFWEVFHELSNEEKRQFLLFLTGSDRIPIHGMKFLKMTIQPTTDDKYLPVAHTCFNLLDLPPYQTKERLKYKLLQAIQHHQGFSLV